jgi:hypothetical protein
VFLEGALFIMANLASKASSRLPTFNVGHPSSPRSAHLLAAVDQRRRHLGFDSLLVSLMVDRWSCHFPAE